MRKTAITFLPILFLLSQSLMAITTKHDIQAEQDSAVMGILAFSLGILAFIAIHAFVLAAVLALHMLAILLFGGVFAFGICAIVLGMIVRKGGLRGRKLAAIGMAFAIVALVPIVLLLMVFIPALLLS